jgi:hypothetical protein
VDTQTLICNAYCLQEISKEGEVAVLHRIQKTCGQKRAKWARRGHIDGEHYDGPTSMERLQAHHDRMDKLARVHTRLPEQIMLDAALAAERIAHEGGDEWIELSEHRCLLSECASC